jgi:arsenite methyltransferase
METLNLKEIVREKYGEAALRAASGATACCDPITSDLYDAAQTDELPREAVNGSLGCGNPSALAQLSPGETVLDLGSGGGIENVEFLKGQGKGCCAPSRCS